MLWVSHQSPVAMVGLCPDGIVIKDAIPVECIDDKCPYSVKEINVNEAAQSVKGFYLKQTESGSELKVNHGYYYQCQGVLNILNLP